MKNTFWTLSLCLLVCGAAQAAPLDAMLTAHPGPPVGRGEMEVTYDLANKQVDIFKLRPTNPGARSGDYKGWHVQGGMHVLPRLWVDGGYWQRSLDYTSVTASLKSWQLGAQYKLLGEEEGGHALALRASVWGNQGDELRRTSTVTIKTGNTEYRFQSAKATDPRDLQLQLDAIGTLSLTSRFNLSGFVGGGLSRLDYGSISAVSRMGGCDYQIEFTDTRAVGVCVRPNGDRIRWTRPNSAVGVDPRKEAAYSATYLHGGINARWEGERWRLRMGYQYIVLDRKHVDDIALSRGGRVYRVNHILVSDVGYQLTPELMLMLRAQLTGNQFVGEVPMTYNSLTTTQHRRRYGFMSVGLVYSF